MHLPLLLLTTTLTLTLTTAQNNIFTPLPYPECNACLDTGFNSCPGDYHDRSVGQCVCAGEGSKVVAGCVSTAWHVDTLPMGAGENVVRGYYAYCIIFFPQICGEAVDFTDPEYWQKFCGAGAGAGAGSGGGSSGGSGSGSGSGTGGDAPTTGGATGGLGGISPTGTATSRI